MEPLHSIRRGRVLNRLRRITRDGRWIPEIDSLRFIAIFSVFLFHLHRELLLRSGHVVTVQPRYQGLSTLLDQGNRGVPLFFVISGFILGLPFARHWLVRGPEVRLGRYFLRRLTRLEPPYIASYLVAILLFGVFTRGAGITRLYMEHVGAGIVYINSLVFQASNPVNPVTWSLEIEIQFYLLAPVFAQLFRVPHAASRRLLMIFMIAAFGGVQAVFPHRGYLVQHSIAFYAQYFLAGMLLADLYLLRLKGKSGWWDAFALIGWGVFFAVPESVWTQALFPFLLLLLCAAALCSRYLRFFFSNQTIAVIGGMCYSIYLLHFLLIAVFFKVTRYLMVPQDYLATLLIQVMVTGAPVLLLCAVYYAYVERVFMDPEWPAKLWKGVHGSPRPATGALDESEL
jgi:peptidoglycan/LPS O-acetylase OafA/YrhL